MRIISAKSRSARGASHQPAFMGSSLTIGQICLPCPPSGQIRLNPGAWWGKGKYLVQCLGSGICMSRVSHGLWCSEQINCQTRNSILIGSMVVMAESFPSGSPRSILRKHQITFWLLPRNQSIKAMWERGHEVMSKWRQMTLKGIGELRIQERRSQCLLADCCGWAVILCYCLGGICWGWAHWQKEVGCVGSQDRKLTAREPLWKQNGLPPIVNIMHISHG